MANNENLKKFGSEREPREAGRKGGQASGKARRRKRDMREAARLLLNLPATGENTIKNLESMGISERDFTNQMVLMVRVFQKLVVTGDVRAAEFLRDTAGYNPHISLEEKRFEEELSATHGGSDSGKDWIDSSPDVSAGGEEEGEDGGDIDSSIEETEAP